MARVGKLVGDLAASRGFVVTDAPSAGVFEAMRAMLDTDTQPLLGPARPHLLVIPILDDFGTAMGGLWGFTLFQWLCVQMLVVPVALRRRGVGTAIMRAAEREAARRGCRGAHVDAFDFQAGPFYRKLGYDLFGVLRDYPPGHRRLYFRKNL
jgi:GNAT superfamily N-acetyltransferase